MTRVCLDVFQVELVVGEDGSRVDFAQLGQPLDGGLSGSVRRPQLVHTTSILRRTSRRCGK
jgi:hypothetical protein